jgi:sec-independent protein translocase protein TatB
MFDVGFSELIVIALVALIVIGPERLPRVARTMGALLGRAQRYVNDVKADIQREVDLDELKSIRSTFQDAAKSVEQSMSKVGEELHAAQASLTHGISGAAEDNTAAAAAGSAAAGSAAAEAAPAAGASLTHAISAPAETAAAADGSAAAPAAAAAGEIPTDSAQMDLGLEPTPAAEPAAAPKA